MLEKMTFWIQKMDNFLYEILSSDFETIIHSFLFWVFFKIRIDMQSLGWYIYYCFVLKKYLSALHPNWIQFHGKYKGEPITFIRHIDH